MTDFQVARLKLTGWYMLISAVLLIVFSLAAFSAEQLALQRINRALADPVERPRLTHVLQTRFEEYESEFWKTLLAMDIVLFIVASFGAYVLSGKTLQPIEQMIQEQEAFAGEVSHQLRTPLTVMKTELMTYKKTTKKITPDVQTLVTSSLEEVERMKRLIEELLQLVRPTKPTLEKVDITDLVNSVITATEKTISGQRSITSTSIHKTVVKTNKEMVRQVIEILIDNAVKYSNDSVDIKVEGNGVRVKIEVKDNGIGINKNDQIYIFERFFRGSQTKGHGNGLGLSIAKKLVSALHGRIFVKSDVGKGSVFVVELPVSS